MTSDDRCVICGGDIPQPRGVNPHVPQRPNLSSRCTGCGMRYHLDLTDMDRIKWILHPTKAQAEKIRGALIGA